MATRRPSGQSWRRAQRYVMRRDGYACIMCGAMASDVDHIIPLTHDGSALDRGNLVAMCAACNNAKGGKLIPERFALLAEVAIRNQVMAEYRASIEAAARAERKRNRQSR